MSETKTQARPTINVRPVAVGATNAATIAGATIAAAGGPLALAAVAAGAVGVATVAGSARKARKGADKKERAYRLGFDSSGGSGRGGSGGSRSGGTSGGRSGGGTSGLGRSSAATPGRRPPGSKPSPFPRTGASGGGRAGGSGSSRGSGAGAGAGGKGRPSSGGDGHRKAGSKPGSSRNPLTADRVAAARRRIANRRQPGPRLSEAIRKATTPGLDGSKPTARQAWTAARKAVTGDAPKRRGTVRRALAGVTAAGLAAGKVAWDQRRKRKRIAAARAAKAARIQRQSFVRDTVRRAATETKTRQPVPAPAPVAKQTPSPTPVVTPPPGNPSTVGGPMSSPSAMAQMLNLAEQMVEVAAKFQRPEGVMELLEREYKMLPEVQRTVAKAWQAMHVRATDPVTGDPLPPVVMDLLDELYRHQLRNADTADQIVPLAKRLEQAKIDALADPRNRMWDHRANQGHAS